LCFPSFVFPAPDPPRVERNVKKKKKTLKKNNKKDKKKKTNTNMERLNLFFRRIFPPIGHLLQKDKKKEKQFERFKWLN